MFNKDHTKWIMPSGLQTSGQSTTVVKHVKGSGQLTPKVVVNRPPTKERKETTTKETTSVGTLGNEVIYLFKEINPSYKELYKRKNQHSAAERLVAIHGFERLKKAMVFLTSRRTDQFCPSISSPSQLEDKWAALEKYAVGRQSAENIINKPKWKVWN